MTKELAELVEFLHHGNTQIRQIACEHLVGYSSSHVALTLFKKNQLTPIADLKLLVRDYPPIAKNALTILINLSSSEDEEILKALAEDDAFLTLLVKRVTSASAAAVAAATTTQKDGKPTHTTVQLTSELLANLSKSPSLERLLKLELPTSSSSKSPIALNQLLDQFVSGGPQFDYLSYLLANLSAAHASIRTFLLTGQEYDGGVVPLSKLVVFTSLPPESSSSPAQAPAQAQAPSLIRRRGVASTLKNVVFEAATLSSSTSTSSTEEKAPSSITTTTTTTNNDNDNNRSSSSSSTGTLLSRLLLDKDQGGILNILPYILLPLAGPEEYSAEESEAMPAELQLLPADKQREPDEGILVTLVETLLLLTTTKQTRHTLRQNGVYPIVRVLHEKVDSQSVREVCERLVDMLMRDEEEEKEEKEEKENGGKGGKKDEEEEKEKEKDKDREIEEVF